VVTELLVEHFPNIVDYGFTSSMEQQLDDIAEGQKKWVPVLREFYGPFERTLATAKETMRNIKREDVSAGLSCVKCGTGELMIKFGRNGEFLACNRYPECDFTSDFHRDSEGQILLDAASAPETSDVMCNLCGKPMIIKKSRFGPFLGCSGYPECKNTRRIGKDGKPVFRKGYGVTDLRSLHPIGPETNFRLASLTKQFTATAIMQLQEQGKFEEAIAHFREAVRIEDVKASVLAAANQAISKKEDTGGA
jgi:DNA topoisomerase-1